MDATINGIRMHWEEAGQGPAVLLVHGFPFHGALWQEQLERLPRRWRWIAPDLRGFGRTELGDPDGPLTMELFADDLAAALDRWDVERAIVCGLSMGGYIAFALWRRHRDRVRGLVLCDTKATADTDAAREGRRALADRVAREGASAAVEELLPRLLSGRTRRDRPDVVRRLEAMMASTPPDTIVRALEGMAARPDSTGLLPEIGVPALVVVGSEDALVQRAEAEAMASELPDARLRVIEGAGHVPCLEEPAAFDTALVHFLEAVEGQ